VTRPVSHWALAGLALLLLAVFGTFLWWFGPWQAQLGFGIWALFSAPLLVAGYRRTRIRWLLYLGTGLVPAALAVGLTSDSFWMWDRWQGMLVMAVCASLPLALTIAWLHRLFAQPVADQPRRWTIANAAGLLAAVVMVVPTFEWARRESEPLAANPAYTSEFAGCYSLEFGPWIPSEMLGHGVHGIVPDRIRLDTVRGDTATRSVRDGGLFEFSQHLIRPGWWGSAYWEPITRDRVQLIWNTGFNGVGLDLRRHGGELRGKATGHTDVGGPWPEPRARVRARPIDCALVAPDTARRLK